MNSIRHQTYLSKDYKALRGTQPKYLMYVSLCLVMMQILGGIVGEVSLYISFLMGAFLVRKRRLENYIILIILMLPSFALGQGLESNITVNQYGEQSWYAIGMPSLVSLKRLLFMDFSVPLIVSASAAISVGCVTIGTLLRKDNKLSVLSAYPYQLSVLWTLSFIPAFYSAWLGYSQGNIGAALSVRVLLSVGGIFWGILAALEYRGSIDSFIEKTLQCIFCAAILFLVGLFSGDIKLILPAFLGGLSAYYFQRGQFFLLVFPMLANFIFLTRFNFTTAFSCFFTLGLSLSLFNSADSFRRLLSFLKWPVALVGLCLFPLLIFNLKDSIGNLETTNVFTSRLIDKVFSDRYNVWVGTVNLISQPPYVFVPSGRSLLVTHYTGRYDLTVQWGAHNFLLECYRQLGLLFGSLPVLIAAFSFSKNLTNLKKTKDKRLVILIIGVVVSEFLTCIAYHYLASERIGFAFWSFSGILIGLAYRLSIERGVLDQSIK